jgi:hypothetical protein
MGNILQGGVRDTLGQDTSGTITTHFAVTNLTPDLALNCDSTSDAELADVLGTVIRELIAKGILQGTTA